MVAAVVGHLRLGQKDLRAWLPGRLLAGHHDVARTDDVETIGGTTAIDDHVETTLTGRQTRDLDDGAHDIGARWKYASRGGRVGDGGR